MKCYEIAKRILLHTMVWQAVYTTYRLYTPWTSRLCTRGSHMSCTTWSGRLCTLYTGCWPHSLAGWVPEGLAGCVPEGPTRPTQHGHAGCLPNHDVALPSSPYCWHWSNLSQHRSHGKHGDHVIIRHQSSLLSTFSLSVTWYSSSVSRSLEPGAGLPATRSATAQRKHSASTAFLCQCC